MWKTIITRNTGTQETRGDEDYKLKPKQNHCYGHTPQIQKGAKTSNSGVERMPFVTHTHAVFLDQIAFKNQINTIVQGYKGVYCKHQINKILYDPQKNLK